MNYIELLFVRCITAVVTFFGIAAAFLHNGWIAILVLNLVNGMAVFLALFLWPKTYEPKPSQAAVSEHFWMLGLCLIVGYPAGLVVSLYPRPVKPSIASI